jgi:broad specificity phosphatase PhoE
MSETDPTYLILIPQGQTCWDKEDRLVGNADLPLSSEGLEQVDRWSDQLKSVGIDILFSAPGGPAEQTARMIAGVCRVRARQEVNLAEMDLGLWQGMPPAEIRQRHPRVHKQWLEKPETVTPPEGENIALARERLDQCIARILRKNKEMQIGVVLGPIALALARLSREGRTIGEVWELVKEPITWHRYLIENNPSADADDL